ncbi:MAG: radical SAM/Cys-rich domain protein [Acidobacteria bacterium]|nr:radical SAM/Cys-rich domain protein [Acidobacteriota bacterium]
MSKTGSQTGNKTGSLISIRHPLASTAEQLRVLEGRAPRLQRFSGALAASALYPLRSTSIQVLQVNVGKLCNQTCGHCHVDAGPDRRESMTRETAELCLEALEHSAIPTLDITGGAPELNPNFRWMVERARALDRQVIDRCNLTVLLVASQSDLPEFLALHQVEIIASLPYYQADRTDAQRGEGVFEDSIAALKKLNALGYGDPTSGLQLNLVYNPVGAFLPPAQHAVEADFRRELGRRHGVVFNSLYTITNMPISRFLEYLDRSGNHEMYMEKLVNAYNPAAAAGVMCRTMVSVGWDGTLYDCDFNQMLDLPVGGALRHIRDFSPTLGAAALAQREITIGQHCYGCTAGAGSSCGGTLTA